MLYIITPEITERCWQALRGAALKTLPSQLSKMDIKPSHHSHLSSILRDGWAKVTAHLPPLFGQESVANRNKALSIVANAWPSYEAERLCNLWDVTLKYGCGGGPRSLQQRLGELATVMREAMPATLSVTSVNTSCFSWCVGASSDSESATALTAFGAALDTWLRELGRLANPAPPQMLFIAVQEAAELESNPKTFSNWYSRVSTSLSAISMQMVGTSICQSCCVFVAAAPALHPRISCVSAAGISLSRVLPTGHGSVTAALSFQIDNTLVCATTLALSGGQEIQFADRRTLELRTMLAKLQFPRGMSLLSHDQIVMLGNFNARVLLPIRNAKAATELLASQQMWDALAQHDQLRNYMRDGGALAGFHEGRLAFPYTYKSGRLEQQSWCDRVIFSSTSSLQTTVVEYTSIGSDDEQPLAKGHHRPIAATLTIQVGKVQIEELTRIRSDYLSATGALEPTVCLQPVDTVVVDELREALEEFGELEQLRVLGKLGFAIFTDLRSAESCAALKHLKINEQLVTVHLRPVGTVSKPLTQESLMIAPPPPARNRKVSREMSDVESSLAPGLPALLPEALWLVGTMGSAQAEEILLMVNVEEAFLIRRKPGEDEATATYAISFIPRQSGAKEKVKHYNIKVGGRETEKKCCVVDHSHRSIIPTTQRGPKGVFQVKTSSYSTLAEIVHVYRRQAFADETALVYPVNGFSAAAFQASLALGKTMKMAIRVLFDPGWRDKTKKMKERFEGFLIVFLLF